MDYYAETNYYDHDKLMIASGKGRDDYFEIFRRCGLERIDIRVFRHGEKMTPMQRLKVEAGLKREWTQALSGLGKGDSLFLSTPPSEKFTGLASVIREVRKRGCKIVIVVFDLEEFITPYYRRAAALKFAMSSRLEAELFDMADVMMVHNDRMLDHIADMGIDPGIMVPVGVMDYLNPDEPDAEDVQRRMGREKPLVFCGNLVPGKAGFLAKVPDDLNINAYGPGFESGHRHNIEYKGVLPPFRLMDELSGSFGLVWDGDSPGTPSGVCGEYLKCNNPHKMALYLASGMPVIVWEGSAMADYVQHEKCGFAVSDLAEIQGRIAEMTDAEYGEMVRNAVRVGTEMRRGDHIRAAVERAMQKVREQEAGLKQTSNDRALIIFTREPEPGRTKTRLMPYLSPEDCAELHCCMIRDIASQAAQLNADVIVSYTCSAHASESADVPPFLQEVFGGRKQITKTGKNGIKKGIGIKRAVRNIAEKNRNHVRAEFIKQSGDDLGSRMENAFAEAFAKCYKKVILIGTDIPELEAESIDAAFAMLDVSDVVLGPTEDGGYYLIGMKALHHEAFDVKLYGVSSVYEETAASIRAAGLSVSMVDSYADIDTPQDVSGYRHRMREDSRLRHFGSCIPARDFVPFRGRIRERLPVNTFTGRFLSEKAKISVIIPVYNEAAEIGAMLDQLRPYLDECEIIFVDGGSTDGTAEMICGNAEDACAADTCRQEADGFTLIKTEKGRGRQLNAGALASSGDILFFLHCDSILPDEFLREIRRVMSRCEWGCFGVKFPSKNFFMLTNRIISNHRAVCRSLPFGDQGIFIDRSLFFEAGMFPEQPVMEDYEFSLRIRRYMPAPGLTRRRIVSSSRRYGKGTLSILKTELCMFQLRYLYRKGVSAEKLQRYYRDIR